MKEKNSVAMIGAAVITVLGLGAGLYLCGLFSVNTALAQDSDVVTMGSSIENAAPEILGGNYVAFYHDTNLNPVSIDLIEGSSADLTCRVNVADPNGCTDLDGATQTAYIYYSGASGAPTCVENGRDCYHATCTYVEDSCAGGTSPFADFVCTVNIAGPDGLRYYAQPSVDPAGWYCHVIPKDEGNLEGIGVTGDTPTQVNELLAFEVRGPDGTYPTTDAIAYGSIALNAVSDRKTVVVRNTGNLSINADVRSEAAYLTLPCTIGSIPIGNQNYSLTDSFEWYSATADSPSVFHVISTDKLLGMEQPVTTYSQDIAAGVSSMNVYWKLKMPETGVSGSCTGGVAFTVEEGV
jgi:hypothetical protein